MKNILIKIIDITIKIKVKFNPIIFLLITQYSIHYIVLLKMLHLELQALVRGEHQLVVLSLGQLFLDQMPMEYLI